MFFHKTGCARQSESKLSLRSLALFLYKTGCARQFDSKLSLRSLALFFNKRDGILRILHRYSSRRMSGRFVTAVFTCLCNSLSHNGLRNGLFGLAKEAFPRCRTGFSAWRRRLSGGAIRSFRGHGRGFPVLRNRFLRVVKTMERTFYPHFSVSRYLFLRICNVNRLISVNICMVSRHRVCCTGAFPPSWRVRSSAVQPELR